MQKQLTKKPLDRIGIIGGLIFGIILIAMIPGLLWLTTGFLSEFFFLLHKRTVDVIDWFNKLSWYIKIGIMLLIVGIILEWIRERKRK